MAAAGAAGASTGSAAKFVLNNASMAASGAAAGGPVGTSGSTAATYSLDADASKVTPHLNQRVEITGQVQVSAGLAPGQGAAAGATPTLKVDSVKKIADTCAPLATTPGTSGQGTPERAPQPRPEPRPESPVPAPVVPPQP